MTSIAVKNFDDVTYSHILISTMYVRSNVPSHQLQSRTLINEILYHGRCPFSLLTLPMSLHARIQPFLYSLASQGSLYYFLSLWFNFFYRDSGFSWLACSTSGGFFSNYKRGFTYLPIILYPSYYHDPLDLQALSSWHRPLSWSSWVRVINLWTLWRAHPLGWPYIIIFLWEN